MSSNWEDFKKELLEKGYLEQRRPGFFLRLGLGSLTPSGSVLRLGILSAALTSALLSLGVTVLVSLTQKTFVPQAFVYYLLPLFLAALAAFVVLTAVFRFHPLRNPTGSALLFSFLAAVPASFILFRPFHLFLPERLGPLLLFVEIALTASLLFPPLRALAFITWREPDLGRYRAPVRVLAVALVLLCAGSLIYFVLPRRGPSPADRVALDPLSKPLAVIAVDGLDLDALVPPGELSWRPLEALPTLKSVIMEGATVPLTLEDAQSPPVFWTQVATGFPPDKNGIVSLAAWRLRGIGRNLYPLPLAGLFHAVGLADETLASTAERKKPAFWELASWAGRSSVCVNWWSSWPPKDPNVGVVSNLYLIQRLKGKDAVEYQHAEVIGRPVDETIGHRQLEGPRWDELAFQHLRELLPGSALATAYFPGLDVDLYNLRRADLMDGIVLSSSLIADLGNINQVLDRMTKEGFRILLIASTGRREEQKAWAVFYPVEGKAAAPAGAGPEDLFPTILHALGMPLPQNIRGRSIAVPWDLPAPKSIPAYPGLEAEPAATTRPPVEELRSLGYLQ